jgi:hypothetical protein
MTPHGMTTLLDVELWTVVGTGVAIFVAVTCIRAFWRRGKGMRDR